MVTLLHLSDLHFTTVDAGNQFDRDAKIREALMNDLGKDGRTAFDAILITGDVAYHGLADEFQRAKEWFEQVRELTNSVPEALFFVPGNHDVNRKKVEDGYSLWDLHQSVRQAVGYEPLIANLQKKLKDPIDFLGALRDYRNFASEYDCPTEPKELAWMQTLDDHSALEDGSVVRFHGLNSSLLSDGDDTKANLVIGTQFRYFDDNPRYINVVLCHHPHSWLIDGNEVNDHLRNQAHIVLTGHEHTPRCYKEGGSVRLFAGAVHPNPREAQWLPCYHVLRLSIVSSPKRTLKISIETRVWRDQDKSFVAYMQRNNNRYYEDQIELPDLPNVPTKEEKITTVAVQSSVSSPTIKPVPATINSDALAAARRKLIVHFFRLGVLVRYNVVIAANVWDETDDALEGQARWARVFERAEKMGKLADLWKAVAEKDTTLKGQTNPFINQSNA